MTSGDVTYPTPRLRYRSAVFEDVQVMGIRLARLLAPLVGCLLVVAPAEGAAADDMSPLSSSQCGSGEFCLWSAPAFQGQLMSATSGDTMSLPFATSRSVWNRTPHAARVYSGAGGTGSSVCIAPGTQWSSVQIASGSVRVLTSSQC